MVAGLIDVAILGAVDIAVIAFTLQLTAVPWTQVGRLPMAPLAAFLALLAIGYLTMFTVLAGQTAGKMADRDPRRRERRAAGALRSRRTPRAVQVLTVPLLGIGFLPALLGADRRALYDRLSDTEVVRSDALRPRGLDRDVPGASLVRVRHHTLMSRIAVFIASCAYIGYIPFAPGTFGSIPGLALGAFLQRSASAWALWLTIAALTAIGIWAATAAESHFGHKDPGPVVIDEVVGMMITMGGLPLGWIGLVHRLRRLSRL